MSVQAVTATAMAGQLKQNIENCKTHVGAIGLGYIGLALFSEQRFPVAGFDIDRQKVKTLKQGRFMRLSHHGWRLPGCLNIANLT